MGQRSFSSTAVRRQRGAAAVEFALIVTLLISIVAGIVGFGRTIWYYDALSKATRNGARLMSVSNPATLASVAVDAVKSSVTADAVSAGLPAFSAANVSVACIDTSFVATTCTNGISPAGVRVSITGYSVLLGSYMPFLLGASSTYTINLTPATTMPFMK